MSARIPETRPLDGHAQNFRKSPLRELRGMFVRFVQGLFAGAPSGEYRWNEDDTISEIIITNEMRIDPEVIQKRPCITFTRGPAQFYSLGIDDLLSYEMDIERKVKSALIPGTMSINCISRVMLESEDLAWWISEYIWLLRDIIMAQGLFDVGRAPQIGAPSPAGSLVTNDQGDEFTVVTVSIPWQLARTSSYMPLGKNAVGNVTAPLGMRLKRVAAQGGPALMPNGYPGYPLTERTTRFAGTAATSEGWGRTPDPAGVQVAAPPKELPPGNPAVTTYTQVVQAARPGTAVPSVLAAVPIDGSLVTES